jgi:hypothetical protein
MTEELNENSVMVSIRNNAGSNAVGTQELSKTEQ